VILEPDAGLVRPRDVAAARRLMIVCLAAFPLVVALGAGSGWLFGGAASRWHPTVELAERYTARLSPEAVAGLSNPQRLALTRAEKQARNLVPKAVDLQRRFRTAGLWFGIWTGVVIGVKLVSLGMVRRRSEFQPDRTGCYACARCFASCPQERIRIGLAPVPATVAAHPRLGAAVPVPASKSGGCGCGSGGCDA